MAMLILLGSVNMSDPMNVKDLSTYTCGRKSRPKVVPVENSTHVHSPISDDLRAEARKYAYQYVDTVPINVDLMLGFATKFYKMSAIWVEIILYLHQNNGVYIGNYSDFTVALGRNPGPKGSVPNIRKCCIELMERSILSIEFTDSGRPKLIKLNSDWMSKI